MDIWKCNIHCSEFRLSDIFLCLSCEEKVMKSLQDDLQTVHFMSDSEWTPADGEYWWKHLSSVLLTWLLRSESHDSPSDPASEHEKSLSFHSFTVNSSARFLTALFFLRSFKQLSAAFIQQPLKTEANSNNKSPAGDLHSGLRTSDCCRMRAGSLSRTEGCVIALRGKVCKRLNPWSKSLKCEAWKQVL